MEKKIFLVFAFLLGLLPSSLFAATLSLSPGVGEYQVGQTFTAQVVVSSSDKLVNAVSGTLEFPSDKLSVQRVTKDGSILSLWVQEPTYSNSAGSVTFEGVILGNGYQGGSGRIITITFKVNAPGQADLRFANGSILANDGEGTNILEGFNQGRYTLNAKSAPVVLETIVEPAPRTAVFATGPVISSATHPDQEVWYRTKEVVLNWEIPAQTGKMFLGLDRSKNAVPEVPYATPISTRTVNVPDGLWYFSALFEKNNGSRAQSQYVLRVDTVAPTSVAIKDISQRIPFAKKVFFFDAQDSLSGISHFEAVVSGADTNEKFRSEVGKDFVVPALRSGKYSLLVTAFDKAGNSAISEKSFAIDGFEAPTLKEYSKTISKDDSIVIKGTTLPRAAVQFYLEGEGSQPITTSTNADEEGNFTLLWRTTDDNFREGLYTFHLDAIMNGSVYSERTQSYPLVVEPGSREIFGVNRTILILAIIVFLLLLLVTFSLVHFGLKRLHDSRTAARNEMRQLRRAVRSVLNQMRADVSSHQVSIGKAKNKAQALAEVESFSQKVSAHIESLDETLSKE